MVIKISYFFFKMFTFYFIGLPFYHSVSGCYTITDFFFYLISGLDRMRWAL